MPMDRSLYPPNWDEIATEVKQSANWTCAECGRLCRKPGESLFDFALRIEGENEQFLDWVNQTAISDLFKHPQRFTLTVAHMDHRPENCDRSNLKALCAPCHCRYDITPSALFVKRQIKLERQGQLSLLDIV